MLIKENLLIRPVTRYISGLGHRIGDCAMFQNLQVHHGIYQGQPLISNSVFLTRTPTDRLQHVYSTFWSYDGTETYYSTEYLSEFYILPKDWVPEHTFCIGDTSRCWLYADDDFNYHLARSTPALYRMLYQGAHLPNRTFGTPTHCETELFQSQLVNSARIDPLTARELMHVPLGSFTMIGNDSDHRFDHETTESFLTEEEAQRAMRRCLEGVLVSGYVQGAIDLSYADTSKHTFCLTADRFAMVTKDPNKNSMDWVAVDLLTLPLYHVARKHNLKARTV